MAGTAHHIRMKFSILLPWIIIFSLGFLRVSSSLFAPYYDVNLKPSKPSFADITSKTGQRAFHLAFILGNYEGCVPHWGGENKLNDSIILDPIKEAQAGGTEFILAFGGAVGPYLEHLCHTVPQLVNVYKQSLDAVGSKHLDIDVEAPINTNVVTKALAQVQAERPETKISFTLPVQGDQYGLTNALGTDILRTAKANGVRVDIVNAMTMEYPSSLKFGDSVISAGNAVIEQMKAIWPEKSDIEIKRMLGITVMIGRNFNGKVFEPVHAKQLVNWANKEQIGLLGYWSAGRDNGKCAGGGVSPHCSSIRQEEYEFMRIFQGFKST